MKIFQTPSYDRFCLFEMERKSKDFRGMDDNVAYKNKQIDNVEMILSILVDTFISKISFPMQPGPEIGSISDA